MNMQDVNIEWADGKMTTESFNSERDFYLYLRSVKEDTGIGAVDWHTSPINPDWTF